MTETGGQKGFTLIEVIVASLLLTFLVAALLHYHGSSGVSKNQEYYLKAVQVARAEMERLRAFYELKPTATEFDPTGPPPGKFHLFKFINATSLDPPPSPIFHVYYADHGYGDQLFRSIGNNNKVKEYPVYYKAAYEAFNPIDPDMTDKRTFIYFTNDGNMTTDYNASQGQADASILIIDDLGSPADPGDDLLGNIGWWVEDIAVSGTVYAKRVTMKLQFWYPGQDPTKYDPEVIELKTTLLKP